MKLIRILKARYRLSVAVLFGGALLAFMPADWAAPTRMLIAWNSGIGLYLLLAYRMMLQANVEKIRQHCVLLDEGRFVILFLTIAATLASLVAIVAELAAAKSLHGSAELAHVGLAGLTVVFSWSFMQTMFAQLYAHEYYKHADHMTAPGLDFPGTDKPDYWDFIYFAFVIGAAAQTADVSIQAHFMRRIVTLHCILAFFFNTTVLALTVNIGAGLF